MDPALTTTTGTEFGSVTQFVQEHPFITMGLLAVLGLAIFGKPKALSFGRE